MTINDMTEITGLSGDTIRRKIKEIFPEKMFKGKRTILKQNEAVKVMSELRKPGFIQPLKLPQNAEVVPQNAEVKRIDRLETLFEKLISNLPNIILTTIQNTNRQQLTFIQDYYSIKAYCSLKGIKLSISEAIKFGKECTKLSKEKDLTIRIVPDEQFGKVNSYNVEILDSVFRV